MRQLTGERRLCAPKGAFAREDRGDDAAGFGCPSAPLNFNFPRGERATSLEVLVMARASTDVVDADDSGRRRRLADIEHLPDSNDEEAVNLSQLSDTVA